MVSQILSVQLFALCTLSRNIKPKFLSSSIIEDIIIIQM